jgi:hypothetical protein
LTFSILRLLTSLSFADLHFLHFSILLATLPTASNHLSLGHPSGFHPPILYILQWGHTVAQLVEALRYKSIRFPMVSLTLFFRPHYGPGIDSASSRNGYQEYFLGLKTAGA